MMELDISPRQSGKTHRMMQAVHQWVLSGNGTATIVVPSYSMRDLIKKKYDCSDPKKIQIITYNQLHSNDHIVRSKQNNKYFFDEFDFSDVDVPLLKTAYYCTSPHHSIQIKRIIQFEQQIFGSIDEITKLMKKIGYEV